MILEDLNKLTPARLKALHQANITSISDLLHFFPRQYLDRNNIKSIAMITKDENGVTVTGKVYQIDEAGFGKQKRIEVYINDGTGIIKCVWFKGLKYITKTLYKGDYVSVFGNVKKFGRYWSLAHPEIDKIGNSDSISRTQGIVAVYPSSSFFKNTYISSQTISGWIREILNIERYDEFLPQPILRKYNFPDINLAYRLIHLPNETSDYQNARNRFAFEELFLFQLAIQTLKLTTKRSTTDIKIDKPSGFTKEFFIKNLPFDLTNGQKNALSDIRRDLASGKQMNRLIQGDVGSGKTIVAIGAILMCLDAGYQAAFVAPTEILAEQHFFTLSEYLSDLGINIRLLVGGQKTRLREDVLTDIQSGRAHIVVGTHAVLQETVLFDKLGLAVIDEQHRFGVAQRAMFQKKAHKPHVLVMSATPIPRSLAMTVFGELDISVIKGLPSGRKPIRTAIRGEKKRDDVYKFVKKSVEEGGQAYVVYPLIEESEVLDLSNATEGFEKLKSIFPNFSIELLHGRMDSTLKQEIMKRFSARDIDILVSTTVIEVGVDVPNARIMIVEDAERFGLSQLHQLRGRIGRGSHQSYCILMAGVKQSKTARERLKAMEKSNDGFYIAEADLKLRGPGDFLGTRQSGLPEFKHADLLNDQHLLEYAKQEAEELLDKDPTLDNFELKELKSRFLPYLKKRMEYYTTG